MYAGAQIFEAIGSSRSHRPLLHGHSVSNRRIGFKEIAEDVLTRHHSRGAPDTAAFAIAATGDHGWSPPLVRALQHAEYAGFADGVRARAPAGPRDLLDFASSRPCRSKKSSRRKTSAGDSSPVRCRWGIVTEAHATLAIAMNRMQARRIRAKGEDPATW